MRACACSVTGVLCTAITQSCLQQLCNASYLNAVYVMRHDAMPATPTYINPIPCSSTHEHSPTIVRGLCCTRAYKHKPHVEHAPDHASMRTHVNRRCTY
jgi:hypothetical protein